jgi:hypothetical protein
MKSRAFCLDVRGFVSDAALQTLAFCGLNGTRRAFTVIRFQRGTVRVPARKFLTSVQIAAVGIGHQRRLAVNVLEQDRAKRRASDVRNVVRARASAAFNQLHRTLRVTYKTAWFIAHRIREAMEPGKSKVGPEAALSAAPGRRDCHLVRLALDRLRVRRGDAARRRHRLVFIQSNSRAIHDFADPLCDAFIRAALHRRRAAPARGV